MANFIIRRTERDIREAAYKAGLSDSRYAGLARSQEEAHEIVHRHPEDMPGKPLAFDDGGEADRSMARKAGISDEHIEKREWRMKKRTHGR